MYVGINLSTSSLIINACLFLVALIVVCVCVVIVVVVIIFLLSFLSRFGTLIMIELPAICEHLPYVLLLGYFSGRACHTHLGEFSIVD